MKEHSLKESNMAMDISTEKMAVGIRETFRTIRCTEKGSIDGPTVHSTMAIGEKVKCMDKERLHWKKDATISVLLSKTRNKVTVSTTGLMAELTLDLGQKANNTVRGPSLRKMVRG